MFHIVTHDTFTDITFRDMLVRFVLHGKHSPGGIGDCRARRTNADHDNGAVVTPLCERYDGEPDP